MIIWPVTLILMIFFILCDGAQFFHPLQLSAIEESIVVNLRLPRTILAFVVGGCLSMTGFVFQSLFKNDLASPYTLGTASSASLGACFAFFLGLSSPIPLSIAMATASIFLILWLIRKNRINGHYRIILAGVIISYFSSSLVMLLQVLSDGQLVKRMLFWLLGDLNVVGFEELSVVSLTAVFYVLYFYRQRSALSMMSVGQDFAHSKGVDTKRVQTSFLLSTSLLVGVIVSYCGPIGFVGILVPHMIRLTRGINIHQIAHLLFVAGGLYLMTCEYIAQSLLAHYSIPVGIVTSFSGAPFFLWVLFRRRDIR